MLAIDSGEKDPFWQHAFGKRPPEQLFDLARDPDCLTNLASHPDFTKHVAALREKLLSELILQQDPRALGQGDVFDQYDSPRAKTADDAPETKKSKKPMR